jgi:hypothetical protein
MSTQWADGYSPVQLGINSVAACREILDRAYGKAVQPVQGTMEYGVSEQLTELFKENAGNTLGAEIARRAANGAANGQKPH